MTESTLFAAAFVVYVVAAFVLSGLPVRPEGRAGQDRLRRWPWPGFVIHTGALILRTVESGHAPFTNMYESLSFLAWASVLALS